MHRAISFQEISLSAINASLDHRPTFCIPLRFPNCPNASDDNVWKAFPSFSHPYMSSSDNEETFSALIRRTILAWLFGRRPRFVGLPFRSVLRDPCLRRGRSPRVLRCARRHSSCPRGDVCNAKLFSRILDAHEQGFLLCSVKCLRCWPILARPTTHSETQYRSARGDNLYRFTHF